MRHYARSSCKFVWKRNKIEIPFKTVDDIRSAYNFTNLDSFLKIYYEGSKVLITEEDFFDLTWEYILRCKADNIVHTEIFFDPQSHLPRGIKFNTVINGIDKALKKAEKDFGISSKIKKPFPLGPTFMLSPFLSVCIAEDNGPLGTDTE